MGYFENFNELEDVGYSIYNSLYSSVNCKLMTPLPTVQTLPTSNNKIYTHTPFPAFHCFYFFETSPKKSKGARGKKNPFLFFSRFVFHVLARSQAPHFLGIFLGGKFYWKDITHNTRENLEL